MPKSQFARWLFASLALAFSFFGGAPSQAQDEVLLGKIGALRDAPVGDWTTDEAVARGEFTAAWNDFKTYLDASGPAVRASWEAFLEWQYLERVADPAVKIDFRSAELLDRLRRQFRHNAIGFEYAPFARVRNALDRLAGIAWRNEKQDDKPDAKPIHVVKADQLLSALKTLSLQRTEASRVDAVAALDFLGRTRLAPELVNQVLAPHRQPNLIVTVASGLTQNAVQEPVDDTRPVEDVILGTQIHGTARTTGTVTILPAPCVNAGQLNILMNAVACSSNVGYNGPATIHSRGATTVFAVRPLYVTQHGLSAGPSTARCSTSTVIDDIQTRSRLINKIAWKKAGKSQAEAEAIASDHAETRAETSFDERTQTLIDEANANFRDKFLTPMARLDAQPEALDFSSTDRELRIVSRVAKAWHFAAASPPPKAENCDLVLQLHDTFVGNASENVLGGFTLTDEKLAQLMQDYTGKVPEELQITQDKDPWSITFASYQPFGMEVQGNTVRMIVRGKRFTRGEGRAKTEIKEEIDISATYSIERTANGTRLVRQGDVIVAFPKIDGSLNAQKITIRGFLRNKFDNLFKSEFVSEGIQPKGKFAKIGRLQIAQITAENGWLVLGWNRAPALPIGPAAAPAMASLAQKPTR